jgi:peptide/nickel transport system substrate-binding protein
LLFYWWPDYADPYSWFINLFHSGDPPNFNLAYYNSPSLDKSIDSVETLVATNRTEAEKLYKQMQVTLLQEAPAVTVYNVNYQYAMLSGISGLRVNPAYPNVVFVYDLH